MKRSIGHLAVNAGIAWLADADVRVIEILANSAISTWLTEALVDLQLTQNAGETISTRAVESIDHILHHILQQPTCETLTKTTYSKKMSTCQLRKSLANVNVNKRKRNRSKFLIWGISILCWLRFEECQRKWEILSSGADKFLCYSTGHHNLLLYEYFCATKQYL